MHKPTAKQLLEAAIEKLCLSTGCKYVSVIISCNSDKPELPNLCGFKSKSASGDIMTISSYPEILRLIKNHAWEISMSAASTSNSSIHGK